MRGKKRKRKGKIVRKRERLGKQTDNIWPLAKERVYFHCSLSLCSLTQPLCLACLSSTKNSFCIQHFHCPTPFSPPLTHVFSFFFSFAFKMYLYAAHHQPTGTRLNLDLMVLSVGKIKQPKLGWKQTCCFLPRIFSSCGGIIPFSFVLLFLIVGRETVINFCG